MGISSDYLNLNAALVAKLDKIPDCSSSASAHTDL